MESVFGRYRNLIILVGVLFLQIFGLAVQVKRSTENESSRLIRVWAVNAVTPFERSIVWVQNGSRNLWRNYFYLRGVRQENRDLRAKIQQLEIERVRLTEDAEQAHRLQSLLGFKEQYIAKTMAAQVIGSSGSEQSRSVYIDKGSRDGIKPDMAVITSDGIVGKVLRVYGKTSQVLLINDQTSGVGSILEKSRLQGVMRGTPAGEVVMEKVMEGEAVQIGEQVLTSGGDQIFPKGLPVGTVTKVAKGSELFLNIKVKPAADLSRLEEVLVITQQEEREPVISDEGRLRAADILAQRLPSVPEKPAGQSNVPPPTSGLKITPAPSATGQPAAAKPGNTSLEGVTAKPQTSATTTKPSVKPDTSPGAKPAAASAGATTAPANKPAKPKTPPADTTPNSNPSTPPQDQPQ